MPTAPPNVAVGPELFRLDGRVAIITGAGHGIGRPLSYQVADDLASHSLVRLLPEFEPLPLPVQLVTPSAQR